MRTQEFMKKKILFLIVAIGFLCFALIVVIKVVTAKKEKLLFTEDAAQVIAIELASGNKENIPLDDNKITKSIIALHNAGVINITIDKNGVPRDCFGNEFKIICEKDTITVSTAGPDKISETRDDIKYIRKIEKKEVSK
jgi:hypothetical protein